MCTKVKHKGYAHIELIFLTNDFKEKKKKKSKCQEFASNASNKYIFYFIYHCESTCYKIENTYLIYNILNIRRTIIMGAQTI